MNRDELKRRVESECPPHLRAYVPDIWDALWERSLPRGADYRPVEVANMIEYVGRLAPVLAKYSKAKGSTALKLTRLDVLTSDILAEKIAPWLRAVREGLFGSPRPPFQKYEDAIAWLSGKEQKRAGRVNLLPYPSATGWLKHIRVPEDPESPLWLLSDETRQMAEATGFSQASLLMYVLVDTKPLLPRWSMRPDSRVTKTPVDRTFSSLHRSIREAIHNAEPDPPMEIMRRSSVILEFKGRDLTFKELQEIYKTVRGMLHVKKKKSLKQKHSELYELVQGMGGPPVGKGTVAFWRKVQGDWNRRHRKHKWQYDSWKGLQRAYNAILEKVEQST